MKQGACLCPCRNYACQGGALEPTVHSPPPPHIFSSISLQVFLAPTTQRSQTRSCKSSKFAHQPPLESITIHHTPKESLAITHNQHKHTHTHTRATPAFQPTHPPVPQPRTEITLVLTISTTTIIFPIQQHKLQGSTTGGPTGPAASRGWL